MSDALGRLLRKRFGDVTASAAEARSETVLGIAARASCRDFSVRPLDAELVRTLCAVALCAPTKSDLQQRDIVIVDDAALKAELVGLLDGQDWVGSAPALLVFCGNNRRQRLLHAWRGRPFANDHLDAFFNAAVDAGIALATFVTAAESIGLGCCPISAIRNHPERVSELLGLPEHVFPVAGLALGWPARRPPLSLRLPLEVTVHTDRYSEDGLRERIEDYDRSRRARQPYARQRFESEYGKDPAYGWSEDKVRQYSKPERAAFGAFVRGKGFKLD